MAGVNHELHPWVHMSVPASFGNRSLQDATPQEMNGVLFRSVLLALCCIPFDVHALHLDAVKAGEGFHERSTSWMHKTWIHQRSIAAFSSGCTVTDELVIEPRIGLMAPVVRFIVEFLFLHRHKRLVKTFGLGIS